MKIHSRLPCTSSHFSRFALSANRSRSAGATRKLGLPRFPWQCNSLLRRVKSAWVNALIYACALIQSNAIGRLAHLALQQRTYHIPPQPRGTSALNLGDVSAMTENVVRHSAERAPRTPRTRTEKHTQSPGKRPR